MGFQLNKIETHNTSMENCVFISNQNLDKYPIGTTLYRYYEKNNKYWINKVLSVISEPIFEPGKVSKELSHYDHKVYVDTIIELKKPICINNIMAKAGKWGNVVRGNTLLKSTDKKKLNKKVYKACIELGGIIMLKAKS